MTVDQVHEALRPWIGKHVTGAVAIVSNQGRPIYRDTFYGILDQVFPDAYEILTEDRHLNFMPEVVDSVDANGKIVIFIEVSQ